MLQSFTMTAMSNFSGTNLDDGARSAQRVIEDRIVTANRTVYFHSALVSHYPLVQYAKDKGSNNWHIIVIDSETIRGESLAELAKSGCLDVKTTTLRICICVMFDKEYGCKFPGKLDNDLSDLKRPCEKEPRALVEHYL